MRHMGNNTGRIKAIDVLLFILAALLVAGATIMIVKLAGEPDPCSYKNPPAGTVCDIP